MLSLFYPNHIPLATCMVFFFSAKSFLNCSLHSCLLPSFNLCSHIRTPLRGNSSDLGPHSRQPISSLQSDNLLFTGSIMYTNPAQL